MLLVVRHPGNFKSSTLLFSRWCRTGVRPVHWLILKHISADLSKAAHISDDDLLAAFAPWGLTPHYPRDYSYHAAQHKINNQTSSRFLPCEVEM